MQTIVVAARKGGASKTTLTAHLGVMAQAQGAGPVFFLDTDPQKTLTAWWSDRADDTPALMEGVSRDQLRGELANVRSQPGLVFIDTPPLETGTIGEVMAMADLIVIPVRPSPNDFRGVSITVELARKVGKPFVFVVTQAIARTGLTQQAGLILSQFGPVATSIMHNRVDYAASMTDGRTVQEIDPKGKGAAEIRDLWSYISQHLSIAVIQQDSTDATQRASNKSVRHVAGATR